MRDVGKNINNSNNNNNSTTIHCCYTVTSHAAGNTPLCILKISDLKLFSETIAVCLENQTVQHSAGCEQNTDCVNVVKTCYNPPYLRKTYPKTLN
jgi:hypothetical protein